VATPPQVRIGIKITPFRQIVVKSAVSGKDKESEVQHVAQEAIRHTLRARLNRVNHFYVNNFHVETRPLKWVKQSRDYTVQLTIYRQFGRNSEVEETIGSMQISGVLEVQTDGIYVLNGAAFKRFRNKFNAPSLDVAAGYKPADNSVGKATAKGPIPVRAGDEAVIERF
jgi:hypothetical protein